MGGEVNWALNFTTSTSLFISSECIYCQMNQAASWELSIFLSPSYEQKKTRLDLYRTNNMDSNLWNRCNEIMTIYLVIAERQSVLGEWCLENGNTTIDPYTFSKLFLSKFLACGSNNWKVLRNHTSLFLDNWFMLVSCWEYRNN